MRSVKGLVGLILVAVVCATVSLAAPAGAQSSSSMSSVGLVKTGAGTFSLDVEGADIHAVVRAVAEFSGRNIVVGKDVKGTVKVAIHNVGWEEALRSILRTQGLDYVEDNGILRVDDGAKLASEMVDRETAKARAAELVQLETRIIKLNYANATELGGALQSSLTKRGAIQIEKRTNSLIISDLEGNLDRVEKMAMQLDSTTPQIEITAKLVDVDAEALHALGIEWNVSPQQSEFFPPGGEVPFHPFDKTDQFLAGEHNTPVADPTTTITYGIFKNWITLEAQLQMLESNRKANIISNPRITTVDNREAKILVGQKIPLIVQDVAGNPVSQLQTIGIQLRVTPHLTSDKKIIMDLHPEVSDLAAQSTVQGGVIINTSEADTRVMVDDGQTAVIGGLIRTNEGVVRKGIPGLMDVPLLGKLFSSESTVHQNRELIIFVTPRLLTSLVSN